MQRDLPVIIGVITFVIVVVVLAVANNGSKKLSLSDSNSIPTSMILGATSTPMPTQITDSSTPSIPLITMTPTMSVTVTPPIKTPTPTVTTKPTSTPTPVSTQLITCSAATPKSKILAGEFKTAHIAKEAYDVLNLISIPYSVDDVAKLSYWLGEDVNNEVRLYQTTPTTYQTKEFTYSGVLIDRGDDKEIRGTKRCQLTVREVREIVSQDGTKSTEDKERYLDFSLDPEGNLQLTAFRSGKEISSTSGKYSGFD